MLGNSDPYRCDDCLTLLREPAQYCEVCQEFWDAKTDEPSEPFEEEPERYNGEFTDRFEKDRRGFEIPEVDYF